VIRPKELKVRIPITIKDLAAAMKLKASQLISSLFMKGVVLTLNDYLDDPTTIQLLGHDFECAITIDTTEEERLKITDKTIKQEIQESPQDQLVLRSPVATFMGHVDHGKTSLIDAIRKSDIAAGEAGAITQHIGAFKCHTPVGDITILDTPGHEAFSAMRERGADVTDLVVLVIAGDEGIRAQTIEAMQQAQAANVPIMVALNKCDKPNFNPENVYRQLSEHSLLPETWGGTTITVNCSAITGQGIKELLEMLALQAEILELKANPRMRARGTVIESQMHKGLGSVATVLVQNGTLRLGDAIVFDQHWGRVKTMHDEYGREMKDAGPSTPAKITGLSGLPEAGSEFIVVRNEKEAEDLSEARQHQRQHVALQAKKAGLEGLLQKEAQKQEKKIFNLILRADVQGSLEALKHSLEKIGSSKVDINVISAEVGEISESDIELAAASKATIIGFHTQIESRADTLIKELKVAVKLHDIIYHAVDDVKERMVALLDKIAQENDMGEAIVKAIFKSSQLGNIAGCQVADGIIRRNHHIRVVRDKEVIWKGPIASLKRVKEDVREVSKGQECGIVLQGFSTYKEGDVLQSFEISYLTQEL
jgi:translation initiation factor IF-2